MNQFIVKAGSHKNYLLCFGTIVQKNRMMQMESCEQVADFQGTDSRSNTKEL